MVIMTIAMINRFMYEGREGDTVCLERNAKIKTEEFILKSIFGARPSFFLRNTVQFLNYVA